MSEPRCRYMSFLLRLWQVRCEGGLSWRASLESTRTGERQGFVSLDDLVDFLRRQTKQITGISGREGNGR